MRGTTTKTPERVAEARRLRDEGLTFREIGERFDVNENTIMQWVYDPDGSRLRARKDSYAGRCVDCGIPTSGCRGRRAEPRCSPCGHRDAHTPPVVLDPPHITACRCARPMPIRDEDDKVSCLKCGIAVAAEPVAA